MKQTVFKLVLNCFKCVKPLTGTVQSFNFNPKYIRNNQFCTVCVMKTVLSVYTLLLYTTYQSLGTLFTVGAVFMKHALSNFSQIYLIA